MPNIFLIKVANIKVQLIEQVQEGNYDIEGKLWCREKYWQAQLEWIVHRTGVIPIGYWNKK